jgi:hypothetical protein
MDEHPPGSSRSTLRVPHSLQTILGTGNWRVSWPEQPRSGRIADCSLATARHHTSTVKHHTGTHHQDGVLDRTLEAEKERRNQPYLQKPKIFSMIFRLPRRAVVSTFTALVGGKGNQNECATLREQHKDCVGTVSYRGATLSITEDIRLAQSLAYSAIGEWGTTGDHSSATVACAVYHAGSDFFSPALVQITPTRRSDYWIPSIGREGFDRLFRS